MELVVCLVVSRSSHITFVINFMQAIYSYVPEINHVSKVRSVAAGLYLQFVNV